MADSKIDYSPK